MPELIDIIIEYIKERQIIGNLISQIKVVDKNRSILKDIFRITTDRKYIYMTDRTHKLYVIDKEGKVVICRDNKKRFYGTLYDYPHDLCVYGTELFMADHNNARVQVFSLPECVPSRRFKTIKKPESINICQSQIYIISDNRAQVAVHTLQGKFLKWVEAPCYGQMSGSYILAISDGKMYVTNYDNNELVCMSFEGKLYFRLGEKEGILPYNFDYRSLMITDDFIYVCAYDSILQLNNKGKLIKRIENNAMMGAFCATYLDGLLYVTNRSKDINLLVFE